MRRPHGYRRSRGQRNGFAVFDAYSVPYLTLEINHFISLPEGAYPTQARKPHSN
jgi:hypothetical protein